MITKCGPVKIWHWAHKDERQCRWWKPETVWHRTWKERFPDAWQEVFQTDTTGERHIADVKTEHEWVLEFQHSPIKLEERRSREGFYEQLIWVVDVGRNQKLEARFSQAYETGASLSPDSPLGKLMSEGAQLRKWVVSDAHVFFDFGGDQLLWWLSPASGGLWAYVQPLPLATFVEIHRQRDSDEVHEFARMADDFSRKVAYWAGPDGPSFLTRRG